MSARPLDLYGADQVTTESQPVRWWVLINQAEWLTAESGWGLANTWRWIHKDNYPKARETLAFSLAEWNRFCDMYPRPDRNKTPWELFDYVETRLSRS